MRICKTERDVADAINHEVFTAQERKDIARQIVHNWGLPAYSHREDARCHKDCYGGWGDSECEPGKTR